MSTARWVDKVRRPLTAAALLQEAHRLGQLDAKNDPLDFVFGDLVETFTADETAVLAALVHFSQRRALGRPGLLAQIVAQPLADVSPLVGHSRLQNADGDSRL